MSDAGDGASAVTDDEIAAFKDKATREFDEWEWSFEGIQYRLDLGTIDDLQMERVIVEAVQRLPRDIGEYVINQCVFVSVGRANYAITLPGRLLKPKTSTWPTWLIVLEDRIPAKWAHGIVAHEIAHAWLKHDRSSPELPANCEVQAADLARSWGFTGRGADVEAQRRRLRTFPSGRPKPVRTVAKSVFQERT